MSYEDDDVSMSSCRDDSFNMSVQHDAIEVVWASTQSPAVTSILEESKLNKHKIQSTDWNRGEPSFPFGGSTGNASLFKDTTAKRPKLSFGDNESTLPLFSDSRSRPLVNRSCSTPIISTETKLRTATVSQSSYHLPVDPRKVRPSQRQSLLQSSRLESTAGTGKESPTESLEALREMIQGVSRRWNKASASSPSTSTTTHPGPASTKANDRRSSDLLPQLQISGLESKPRPKGVLRRPEQQMQILTRSNEGSRLMLPPAIPPSRQNTAKPKLQQPGIDKDDMEISDMSIIIERADHRYSPPDLPEPVSPCPKERIRLQSEASLYPQATLASSPLRPSRSNSSLGAKPTTISPTFATSSISAQFGASTALNGQKKVLGMRRTASGNRFETSTSRPASLEPSVLQRSEGVKRASTPQSYSQSQSQSNRVNEPARGEPRSFEVPWQRQSPHVVAQVISDAQSPTDVAIGTSSQTSQSGSDSARSPPTSLLDADKTFAMNCDDSYSFDELDVDAEELHQVLSQCGA
ncbi:hypothetical protein FRC18_007438 [Serendipita sp. 400]|nr:hypothetical protein FRC18_007438 [Serendipita sp. 400]